MDSALLIARLALAGIFAVSGIAKLADLPGAQKAMAGFGVPARLVMPAAIALPLLEVLIAALLIPTATAWWAALAALMLLAGFIAGIVYNLRQGRQPDCHCFGKLGSEPIGTPTIVRDLLFALPAAFVVAGGWGDPGASAVAWYANLRAWEQVLSVLVFLLVATAIGQTWMLLQMLRQNGRLLLRLDAIEDRMPAGEAASRPATPEPSAAAPEEAEGLPEGSLAPAFKLDGLNGETQTLDALRASGRPVLLIFTDPKCRPCNALMPDIGRWQQTHARRLSIAVISRGGIEANRPKATEHGLSTVLLQQNWEVSEAYRVKGTPSAVLVRSDGTIAGPPARGSEQILQLVANATRRLEPLTIPPPSAGSDPGWSASALDPASRNGNHAPAPLHEHPTTALETIPAPAAPAFSLPDLDGNEVTLQDLRGHQTMVVFWNPSCGYCRRMAGDLKAWEDARPEGAPKLLLVSTGTVEANREFGFAAPMVLDQTFATATSFGASVTPSVVLIDADGNVASPVFVGAQAVMALANGADPATIEIPKPAPLAPKRDIAQLEIGDPAPPIKLTDLDGNEFDLAAYAGQPVGLIFWSLTCGFCEDALPLLKELESRRPADTYPLVLISDGDAEGNRNLGLRSRIVLDEEFTAGPSIGVSGTPSALLIDAEGRVASKVSAGGRNMMDLLGFNALVCDPCIEDCKQRGGGEACLLLCRASDKCV